MTRNLFLDVDGVLADFDGGFHKLTGMTPEEYEHDYGKGRFWKTIASSTDFYGTLDLLPGAMEMVDAVRHLEPTLLTGLPLGKWAAPQKRRWAKAHFPDLEIITCMARDKWKHGSPGDVLVDDRISAREPWEERAGGTFILHTSPKASLAKLSEIFDL
ncbi:hypothetical protein [Sphingomicrobium clamense]|uniref:Uncharacterized protein n=1 Tax=Sphingomicrobium clamense TaxID=2851013 RepID=A0ABS6V511_9SPHN|nr:hypothetical protein [Sphingomicrobium sp. B8]MBW0144642.1 hypothetical protein [Sphingomicrobium sp. B8]